MCALLGAAVPSCPCPVRPFRPLCPIRSGIRPDDPAAGAHHARAVSITESHQRATRRVITASELASRLGPTARGVRVLFIGLGEEVYELELPYIKLPSLRAPIMPADWTRTRSPQPASDLNGKAPSEPPIRLTQDLADQIRRRRR